MRRFLSRLGDIWRLVSGNPPHPSTPAIQHWSRWEEPLQGYRANGYHPAAIGDILGSRYRILRKLGWGVYSTVWLVQNQSDNSYAALKLMIAAVSNTPQLQELEYLQRINNQDAHHPGYSHVIQLSDHFYHDGPNGKNLCLVTDVMAESTFSFMQRKRMPIAVAKHVTRQVLIALDYLHNTCNIVHTDIKTSNVLFALDVANDSSLLTTSETATQPDAKGHLISRVKSNPIPISLPDDTNKDGALDSIVVRLVDVGVACWADRTDEHITDMIQSPALRAPEVFIGAGWGKPADIWSLGLMVYELVMGDPLIHDTVSEQSIPYIHMVIFGDYPLEMIKKGKYSSSFVNDDGSRKYQFSERLSLEAAIRKRGAPPDADDFVDFLKLMLRLDPALRASLEELLAHRWLSRD